MLCHYYHRVFRACIECLGFQSGPFAKNCSAACINMTVTMVDQFTTSNKECNQRDSEGCRITFQLFQLVGEDRFRAEVLKVKGETLYTCLQCTASQEAAGNSYNDRKQNSISDAMWPWTLPMETGFGDIDLYSGIIPPPQLFR